MSTRRAFLGSILAAAAVAEVQAYTATSPEERGRQPNPNAQPPTAVTIPPPASTSTSAQITTTAAEFPQYLLDDSGAFGPTYLEWSQELRVLWPAYKADHAWKFGNWLDASGAGNGPVPYQTLLVGPTTPLNTYVAADVTALVGAWLASGEHRGLYLRSEASNTFNAHATIQGRLGANPPQLVVVTSAGTFTLTGTLAGWSTSSSKGTDTRHQAKLTKGFIALLHFPELVNVTGTLRRASVQLFVTGTHASAVLTLQLMQTDAPFVYVGAHGEAPVLGLAAEAGEDNLPKHPDVYQAGDFRQSNWFTFTDSNGALRANRAHPSPLGTLNGSPTAQSVPGFELEFRYDPDSPGRQYIRASMVHGLGRVVDTSSISLTGQWGCLPNLGDRLRAVDPATVIDEMYVRSYIMLEEDFWTTVDGIKGGLGFDCRLGYWQDGNGGYWQNTTGNSGSKGTGLKVLNARPAAAGRYEYQGHSIRQHFGDCRPSGTPYAAYRPLMSMVSNLGPYESEPYGTEEIVRCGTAVMRKGTKHCIEWRLKMNSIVGPFDALGNGTAVNDGVLELWVDGVHRWKKDTFAWRRHPEIGISGSWILWMHGGTTPAAPGEVMHFRHYDFVAAKRYIGPKA